MKSLNIPLRKTQKVPIWGLPPEINDISDSAWYIVDTNNVRIHACIIIIISMRKRANHLIRVGMVWDFDLLYKSNEH